MRRYGRCESVFGWFELYIININSRWFYGKPLIKSRSVCALGCGVCGLCDFGVSDPLLPSYCLFHFIRDAFDIWYLRQYIIYIFMFAGTARPSLFLLSLGVYNISLLCCNYSLKWSSSFCQAWFVVELILSDLDHFFYFFLSHFCCNSTLGE